MLVAHTSLHRAFDRIDEPSRFAMFLALGCAAYGIGIGACLLLIVSRALFLYGPKGTD